MIEQTYDIMASYQENYDRGPQFSSPTPHVPKSPATSFLGLAANSRIGIAAGLLLNSKWIAGYAARGFDLLTYKTVRSSYRPCYELPNWVFVEPSEDPETFIVRNSPPLDARNISSSVCFGMPSMDPSIWREDIRRAKAALSPGQVLLVSVVATPDDDWSEDMLAEDFVQCASWATEAGADVIEANFSCPNVCSSEGSIYRDAALSARIAQRIRERIGPTPLLIKTGQFDTEEELSNYLSALAPIVDGVTLVNCLIGKVINPDGSPAFGTSFAEAGVLGRSIHDPCVEIVQQACRIIADEGLELQVVAVGGAATSADVARYFEAGAHAVMMGSAPMYLPNFAAEWKSQSGQ